MGKNDTVLLLNRKKCFTWKLSNFYLKQRFKTTACASKQSLLWISKYRTNLAFSYLKMDIKMAKLYTSILPKMLDTVQLLHKCHMYTQ